MEQKKRGISAEHQNVAMREIDDAHDAENEIEAKPDQGEIAAIDHPAE